MKYKKTGSSYSNPNLEKRRVIALLDRGQVEFMDKISTDSSFSTGHKLSRVDIVSGLVQVAMALRISASGVRTSEELVDKVIGSASNRQTDRRDYPRVKKNLEVGFRNLETLQNFSMTKTLDVSLGGFRMDVPGRSKPPSRHRLIEITLMDDRSPKPLKAIGKVAWVNYKGPNQGYEIGVKFAYMTQQDRDRFHGLLIEEQNEDTP